MAGLEGDLGAQNSMCPPRVWAVKASRDGWRGSDSLALSFKKGQRSEFISIHCSLLGVCYFKQSWKRTNGAFSSKDTMLESAHRCPAVKWQDHGWTPLAWDWPSIVQSSCGIYGSTAPVEHTGGGVPLSLMPTAATTGSMVPPVQDIPTPTIPGATVGFPPCPPSSLVLADCSLLPYQLWQPQSFILPKTLPSLELSWLAIGWVTSRPQARQREVKRLSVG